MWADVFSGELAAEGEIAVRPLVGKWRKLLDVERKTLRFDPAVGEIGGKADFAEPVVDHEDYGRSQLCTPAILRLHVDEGERAISDAGRLVKNRLFARHPPFVFNTIACVGGADAGGRGAYPDPNSIWFNVFFGCYQIDAPRSHWSRPFGYLSADGAASRIAFDDITRLGEADWNFFSNWMYGVPLEAIEPYNAVDPVKAVQDPAPALIGRTLWHHAVVEGVTCVSTYESDAPGADRSGHEHDHRRRVAASVRPAEPATRPDHQLRTDDAAGGDADGLLRGRGRVPHGDLRRNGDRAGGLEIPRHADERDTSGHRDELSGLRLPPWLGNVGPAGRGAGILERPAVVDLGDQPALEPGGGRVGHLHAGAALRRRAPAS